MRRDLRGEHTVTTTGRRGIARWVRTATVIRVGAVCLTAALATGCKGCAPLSGQQLAAIIGLAQLQRSGGTKGGELAATTSRVVTEPGALTFSAPADVPPPNARELTAPYDLVPPFRVECVVGLCDPAFYPSPSAVFGMSVVTRTGSAAEFALDVSRTAGMTATAAFGAASPQSFPDAQRIELALEHDGVELVGYARDHAVGGAWNEVSRTLAPAGDIYLPRIYAMNFEPGQMVSFYSLSAPENAPYGAGQATTTHEIVRKLVESLDRMAVGTESLGADTPDAATAELEFRAAAQLVDEAFAALAEVDAPAKRSAADRRRRKAQKAGRKAAKRVAQALGRLSANGADDAPAVSKRLASAAVSIVQAGDQLLPDDLRAAVGGIYLKGVLGR